MKLLKILLSACVAAPMLSSCLGEAENEYHAIQLIKPATDGYPYTNLYANQSSDSIIFTSYSGAWKIELLEGDTTWLHLNGKLNGRANTYNKIGVNVDMNTTGKFRTSSFRILDVDDSRVYAPFYFYQYTVNHDGTSPVAGLVKQISGSDGSEISAEYDNKHRPTHLVIKGENTEREYKVNYHDEDNQVVVSMIKNNFAYKDTTFQMSGYVSTGSYVNNLLNNAAGTQQILVPLMLGKMTTTTTGSSYFTPGKNVIVNTTDSAFYMPFTISNGFLTSQLSYENALHYVHMSGGYYAQYGIFYNAHVYDNVAKDYKNKENSLGIGEAHLADSIIVRRGMLKGDYTDESFVMEYNGDKAMQNNLYTSLDANQLIMGVDQADPYLLMSFFKLVRQTSLVSKAKSKARTISVDTQFNVDKSINSMTVTDSNGKVVTYQFAY